jgi:adenylate kinase
MLRAQVAQKTKLGKEAKKIMDAGGLVSDDIMVNMIQQEITTNPDCQNGYSVIADLAEDADWQIHPRWIPANSSSSRETRFHVGIKTYPTRSCRWYHRSCYQKSNRAPVELSIPDALLVSRITGRLVHPSSGRTYHLTNHPPKVPMKDDVTGEPLIQRSDDNAETLKKRLKSYHDMTTPVVEYYKRRGIKSPNFKLIS